MPATCPTCAAPLAAARYVEGFDVTPRPGMYLLLDGWGHVGNPIRADEVGFATFRIDTLSGGPIRSLALEVEVTGRTLRRRPYSDRLYVRVKVTFPGDCEPDTHTAGWLLVD